MQHHDQVELHIENWLKILDVRADSKHVVLLPIDPEYGKQRDEDPEDRDE